MLSDKWIATAHEIIVAPRNDAKWGVKRQVIARNNGKSW